MSDLPNPFANLPRQTQIKLGVKSDFEAGRVTICEHDDLEAWKEIVTELASELKVNLEVHLNEATDMGFARANFGFPLHLRPYGHDAYKWSRDPAQTFWLAQYPSWNKLFRQEGRSIC